MTGTLRRDRPMRIGEVRTSIKLEQEFWTFLKAMAEDPDTSGSRGSDGSS